MKAPTTKADQIRALKEARERDRLVRRGNEFEDAARGRDPWSSEGGGGSRRHASLGKELTGEGRIEPAKQSLEAVRAEDTTTLPAGVASGPSEAVTEKGEFDRRAYQRQYMREYRKRKKKSE